MKLILSLIIAVSAIAFADDKDSPITNFHTVIEGQLYRGARVTQKNEYEYLAKIGIKTIINLQGGDTAISAIEGGEKSNDIWTEQMILNNFSIEQISKPLNSFEGVTDAEKKSIEDVLNIFSDPAKQPVYVHCAHGADRTGLVIALYMVTHEHMSPKEAIRQMRKNGHNFFHFLFTNAMDRYYWKYVNNWRKDHPEIVYADDNTESLPGEDNDLSSTTSPNVDQSSVSQD